MPMVYTLPVVMPRTYISYSAYKMWKTCQHKFYQYYLAGYDVPKTDTDASLFGNIVDAFIKDYIAKKRNIKHPHLDINVRLTKFGLDADNPLIKDARVLVSNLIKLNRLDRFLNAAEIYLEQTLYLNFNGIPLLGIVDILCDGIPNDIKTRGFFSKNLPSPTPGYISRIDQNGRSWGAYSKGQMPLEEANKDWAEQFLFYCWITKQITPYKGTIIEIIRTSTGFDIMEIPVILSNDTKNRVLKELQEMWDNINNLNCQIAQATPTKWKCEGYGKLCEVASRCQEYRLTLGNPEVRVMYT